MDQRESQQPAATIPQLAKELGISPSWLYERSRYDGVPGQFRLGKYVRVDLEEFYEAVRCGWKG